MIQNIFLKYDKIFKIKNFNKYNKNIIKLIIINNKKNIIILLY